MASLLTGAAALVMAAATALSAPQAASASGYQFDSHGVSRVTAKELGKSWHKGCPVPPRDLRAIELPYWGFDNIKHTGVLIANANAVPALQTVFRQIYRAHFPLHKMTPIAAYDGSDNRSMNHDNTSAFNCRYAVSNGPKSWSEHAYGEAVDVDPRENPYTLNGKVYPPSGAAYVDRSHHRRGMVFAHGPVVRAFDSVGWGWGGRWSSSPDYQHFSVNGR